MSMIIINFFRSDFLYERMYTWLFKLFKQWLRIQKLYRKAKQIKQNAVERIKGELADIVEEETGTRPTKFYVLWLNFL